MNLSFDINTHEGDKVVVSLLINYILLFCKIRANGDLAG